ncbi:hypothetical protein THAOC_07474, partial [Thalassiosira oceanica]
SEIEASNTTTVDNEDEVDFLISVPWLRSSQHGFEFFAIPEEFGLNKSESFQSGRIYGMDATSGAAVAALLFDMFDRDKKDADGKGCESVKDRPAKTLRVLDMCCAPGLKLCMLADLAPRNSLVEGVDISAQRMDLCKKIVTKYQFPSFSAPGEEGASQEGGNDEGASDDSVDINMYCTDATRFDPHAMHGLVFNSQMTRQEIKSRRGKRKRMNKSARAREKRRLLDVQRKAESLAPKVPTQDLTKGEDRMAAPMAPHASPTPVYDLVLVDAECSTDGAIRHKEKASKPPAWNETNMDELVDLQKRLIKSGFDLLKKGGTMVYSTCSLSESQNENVVSWLLERNEGAALVPLQFNDVVHSKFSEEEQATEKAECDAKFKSVCNMSCEEPHSTEDMKVKMYENTEKELSRLGETSSSMNERRVLGFLDNTSLDGTVRFNPLISKDQGGLLPGSGFFIAKIRKR